MAKIKSIVYNSLIAHNNLSITLLFDESELNRSFSLLIQYRTRSGVSGPTSEWVYVREDNFIVTKTEIHIFHQVNISPTGSFQQIQFNGVLSEKKDYLESNFSHLKY